MKYPYLKHVRASLGVSIKEVAKSIGISSAYLSQIETGKRRLTYVLAVRIASYFDLKPDDLFYLDEKNNLNR